MSYLTVEIVIQILIFLLSVSGHLGLTSLEALDVFSEAAFEIQNETGIDLEVWDMKRRGDRCAKWNRVEARSSYRRCWSNYMKRRGWGKGQLKYVLGAPAKITGQEGFYMWGIASAICELNGVAISSGNLVSYWGKERRDATKIGIRHEIYHLLGASHLTGCNVMDPFSWGIAESCGGSLPLAPVSLDQINLCLDYRL